MPQPHRRAIQINDQHPVEIQRDTTGRIETERFGNYLERRFEYSQDGLLTRQQINGSGAHFQRRYTYDPAGNLITRHDSTKGDWHFTYDPMGRIIQAVDPLVQVKYHSYDPAGDLLDHIAETQSGLRSATYQNTTYHFDPAGNLTQRQTANQLTLFEYDEQNRLKTVRKEADTLHMAYDALGRRQRKALNGKRTFFTWDGDTLLSEQFEDGPPREYVYYPGTFEPLAVIDGDQKVYYYHNDVNGLPCELTKPNGDIVWSATYDELGRIDQILVDDIAQPLRLQGQYFDAELDLCYNRYRYFDPAICSFTSQDPIGLAGGDNVYAYAPNVWGWVDPLGLSCKKEYPVEYDSFGQFSKDMSVHGYSRAKLRCIWNQIYKKDKDKFFARSDVRQSLRLKGHLPLLPHEKAIAVHSRLSANDASFSGKVYQASFEFLTNFKRPPNSPPIYDTFWGNMGSLANALLTSIFG